MKIRRIIPGLMTEGFWSPVYNPDLEFYYPPSAIPGVWFWLYRFADNRGKA